MGPRNRLRQELANAVGERLGWAARHDRKGLVIVALQVVYAVWFAALWMHDFPLTETACWGAVFVLSAAGAIALERRR